MGAMSVPVEVGVPKNTDEALLQLTNKSGYTLVQENGQRRFGGPPPEWNGPPPAKGCEIFVGKIPRDCFEDELVPIFESIGPIYELRLMMDFSGTNRGFAFVMYCKAADAKEAIRKMDNYEIRKGRFLGVCKSIDNCRLFVGGIPHMKSREEVFDEMSKITEGVVNVILYSNVTDKSKSRGFAFVEYENHRSAAMARRKLIPGRIQLWSKNIAVDWAEPEPDIDEEIMSKVTILYARNLTQDITENNLKDEFSMNGKLQVEKVKKLKDYAFVHFKSRSDAEIAKSHFHGKILDGSEMEVTWAKPVDKNRNKSEIQRVPGSFVNAIGGPYGQLAGPYLYSNIPPNQVLDQSNPYASTLFTYPIAYPPAQNTGARNTFRGRGRGAAGLRGNNFGKNYRKATDMHLFDLQPGMELIPTNPYTLKPTKPPTQILMEFAQKNNWGEPVYQLHSAVNSDPNRDQIQLFLHKITFPNFPSQFTPTKLTNNVEESKQIAAEYVLIQMGISPETYDQVYYDPGAQLAVVPTVGIY